MNHRAWSAYLNTLSEADRWGHCHDRHTHDPHSHAVATNEARSSGTCAGTPASVGEALDSDDNLTERVTRIEVEVRGFGSALDDIVREVVDLVLGGRYDVHGSVTTRDVTDEVRERESTPEYREQLARITAALDTTVDDTWTLRERPKRTE